MDGGERHMLKHSSVGNSVYEKNGFGVTGPAEMKSENQRIVPAINNGGGTIGAVVRGVLITPLPTTYDCSF